MTYVIKATDPGRPVWAEIKRVDDSHDPMNDPHDIKNRMNLTPDQEVAYKAAWTQAKNGDKDGAMATLKPVFEKVWIEET